MKKIILFLSFVWFALATFAQSHILTVSNYSQYPAQYSSLKDAIDAAQPGDTIYVFGSPNVYSGVTIEKDSLTIIGPGFSPISYTNYEANVSAINIYGGDYITIEGLYLSDNYGAVYISGRYVSSTYTDYSSNIRIEGNYLSGIKIVDESNNIILKGNIIKTHIILGEYDNDDNHDDEVYNIVFANNYIKTSPVIKNRYVTSTFVNNIFTYPFAESYSANVKNNIFYLSTTDTEPWDNCSSCHYDNNLFYNEMSDFPFSTSDTSITNNGNILNKDPQFVNFANPYSVDADYHLQPTSPGHNAGTDGTDLGIYGGGYDFRERGEVPYLPVIYDFSIYNPQLQPNDTLKVKLRVRTNQ